MLVHGTADGENVDRPLGAEGSYNELITAADITL